MVDWLRHIEKGDHEAMLSQDPHKILCWASSRYSNNALHHAARHGKEPNILVPFLISSGLDVNAANARGETPIMGIFERPPEQSLDWMQVLVAHGSEVSVVSNEGKSLASICMDHNHWQCLKLVFENGGKRLEVDSPWRASVEHSILGRRGRYLDRAKWIDQVDLLSPASKVDITRTMLLALATYEWKIASCMIERGACLTAHDDAGNTVPHLVAETYSENPELPDVALGWMEEAIAQGIDPFMANHEGKTVDSMIHKSSEPQRQKALRHAIHHGQALRLRSVVAGASFDGPRRRI